MIEILLCYIFAFLVCIAGLAGIYLFLKKKLQVKLHWGALSIGVITAVVYFFIIMLLFQATFRTEYYYNTPFFRSMVGGLFLALLALTRYMLVKVICFNRYKEDLGYSFSFGFGAAPAVFLAIYLLIMALVIAGNGIFNGPCVIEEEGYLSFADNTIISVFRPAAGHISFAVMFVLLPVMMLLSAHLLWRISEKKYNAAVSVVWVILFSLLETIAILPIPFINMYALKHWQLLLIVAVTTAIGVILLKFMPKEKKPSNYIKQFE